MTFLDRCAQRRKECLKDFTPQLKRLDNALYPHKTLTYLSHLEACTIAFASVVFNFQVIFFETSSKLATIMSSATTEAVQTYAMEHDPRWTAVDAYQFPLLFPESRHYHAALVRAQSNSMAHGLRDISVSPSQGKYLAVQCQLIDAKYVLEIGTLGAYSTIWMASADANIKVTTIEIDPRTAEIARENIRFAGLEGKGRRDCRRRIGRVAQIDEGGGPREKAKI